MSNLITTSLKQSFKLVKKHKRIVLGLLILQIIFLSLMIGLQMHYQMKAFEVAEVVMEYLDQQDLSDIEVAKNIVTGSNILGDDPLMIYRNYRKIAGFMVRLSIYSLVVYLVFGSLNWALTDQLIYGKNKKRFLAYIGKFCLLAMGFLALIFLLAYSSLKGVIGGLILETLTSGNFVYLILGLALLYFMFISFALISRIKFKEILRKALMLGAKKAHIILLVYLINLVIIVLLVRLVHFLSTKSIFLLSLALLLLLFSIVWTRIFLVLVVDKLKI
ncbi:hypothetical protein KY360_05440 [Candidatus Woesearchaeota archaeon]|nr:hypothetical protein [Candidatus Woesearchaeota archaeon]